MLWEGAVGVVKLEKGGVQWTKWPSSKTFKIKTEFKMCQLTNYMCLILIFSLIFQFQPGFLWLVQNFLKISFLRFSHITNIEIT